MDDATRAELAELRRRAFGPTPDIADDPAAMSRLALLEDRSQAEHAVAVAPEPAPTDAEQANGEGTDAEAFVLTTHPLPPPAEEAEVAEPPPRRRRSGAGIALGAAVIAALVVVSTGVVRPPQSGVVVTPENPDTAFALAADENARVLVQVPLHNWFGAEGERPLPADTPPFPTTGTMQWATHLGSYYGWQLWIGGAKGIIDEEECILVARGDVGKGRCVPGPLRYANALAVTLPLRAVPEDDRPAALVPGERLGFWWFHDSAVSIMLTSGPETP